LNEARDDEEEEKFLYPLHRRQETCSLPLILQVSREFTRATFKAGEGKNAKDGTAAKFKIIAPTPNNFIISSLITSSYFSG